jgi:hypothetical protein
LGERSYGDDVAVAPWEGVAAAEDRAHRVHEPADVIAHAALPLLLSFSDVFFLEGRVDPGEGDIYRVLGCANDELGRGIASQPLGLSKRKEAASATPVFPSNSVRFSIPSLCHATLLSTFLVVVCISFSYKL